MKFNIGVPIEILQHEKQSNVCELKKNQFEDTKYTLCHQLFNC